MTSPEPDRYETPEHHRVSRMYNVCFGSYHRQAVAIPAKPPVHVEATLVSKPRDDVLYSASQNVAIMRETSSKGWPIIECVPESTHTHVIHQSQYTKIHSAMCATETDITSDNRYTTI